MEREGSTNHKRDEQDVDNKEEEVSDIEEEIKEPGENVLEQNTNVEINVDINDEEHDKRAKEAIAKLPMYRKRQPKVPEVAAADDSDDSEDSLGRMWLTAGQLRFRRSPFYYTPVATAYGGPMKARAAKKNVQSTVNIANFVSKKQFHVEIEVVPDRERLVVSIAPRGKNNVSIKVYSDFYSLIVISISVGQKAGLL